MRYELLSLEISIIQICYFIEIKINFLDNVYNYK